MEGNRALIKEVSDSEGAVESASRTGGDEVGEPISGRVKWFDMVKGYGFVTPDDGGGDILLHYNLLGQIGRKSLPEGTAVTVVARKGPRGRQAVTIIELDLSTATGPDQDKMEERSSNRVDPLAYLEDAGDFEQVEVRWFNRSKGYGFLLRDDGVTQVFVHMETVRRGGFEALLPGQAVRARIHDGPRGALCVQLAPLG
ncbi:cold-shock protein [Sandaracinobacter neustonicus]|uniref:Cold-shock protein n=1 Tax=Sandaracinobacter neustonicus TaxID=1715348 RepID=A0A501XP43_9SPHN|nr:cold shock protein [Sandaracinobacter neustonicus]TPE62452.1 cold-shock protein [Sandaracinobacter neustonicus]